MAPQGLPKRKRGDIPGRQESYDGQRPSPHRPGDLSMARESRYAYNQDYERRGSGGGRRGPPRGSSRASGRGGNVNGVNSMSVAGDRGQGEDTADATGKKEDARMTGADSTTDEKTQTSQIIPQQMPPASILVPALPSEPPPPDSAPTFYLYEILTDDRIESWTNNGREAVVEAAKTALEGNDIDTLQTIFQEIIRAGLDARIAAIDAGKVVKEVLSDSTPEQTSEAHDLFLDTLVVMTDSDPRNARIRALVLFTGIPSALMRSNLEEPLLRTIGLIRDTFGRMFIRKQTHQLYKQSNYNLLREETEGYSKLITELFTTTGSLPPTSEVVADTFENIKALIGAFDLDAGRVLDVTLDVFANLLVRHYRFFVRLLKQSSWWPVEDAYGGLQTDSFAIDNLPPWAYPNYPAWATNQEDREKHVEIKEKRDKAFWERAREVGINAYFELGGRRVMAQEDLDTLLKEAVNANDDRAMQGKNWIKATGTLPPAGNPVAAQLLGFKLRFYSSAAREPEDVLPHNMIVLAALLIKIGFISLRDLYPHLFPVDDNMDSVKDKVMAEKEQRDLKKRPGGGSNALLRAAMLPDDMPPPASSRHDATKDESTTKPEAENKETPRSEEEPSIPLPRATQDQKVELLKSLLCIGAIPEALYLLGRFPWLQDGYPEVNDHIHRLLHYSIAPVYEPICPLGSRNGFGQAARQPVPDPSGTIKADLRLVDAPVQKTMAWGRMEKRDCEGIDYYFYWQDWANNIPACRTVDDVFTLCNTLLNLSGLKIGRDASLMSKLIRIGRYSMEKDPSATSRARWLDLCKRLLVPALSLTGCNPAVVNETWDLLKLFDTNTRFNIYNEWFLGPTSRLPDIESAFKQAVAETRDVMKRVSKTNTVAMARALAKAACSSPGVVFNHALRSLESYTNFIDIVVDCGKYFTYMGFDVFTWTILSAVGRSGRNRIKDTGINTSLWLLSLSTFVGKMYKRYRYMSTKPILQHVLAQLRGGNITDLQILRELCYSMAGIAADTDFSESQVNAMAGGEILQASTLKQVKDMRHECKISGRRLTKVLGECELGGSLLVSIAQNRQASVFNSNQNQVKVVSENFDSVHISFVQLLDLLRYNMSVREFDAQVPDVVSLISEYGLDTCIAFTIYRKSIVKAMEDYDAAHPTISKKVDGHKINGDVLMKDTPVDSALIDGDQEMTDADAKPEETLSEPEMDTSTPPNTDAFLWHPVMQDLIDRLSPVMPEAFQTSMSMPFFIRFWQLSLNDLMLPTTSYLEEENHLKSRIAALKIDRSDMTSFGIRKRESEQKAAQTNLGELATEMKLRMSKYQQMRSRLEKEKEHWFTGFEKKSLVLNSALLQECFIPRILISPLDSHFSWRILNFLHSNGAANFRTMHFIDILLQQKTLQNLMFQCSGREADNLGRFMTELLKELGSWHADKAEYEKKAYGSKRSLPGFLQKLSKDGEPILLSYEDFQRLLYKWHSNIHRALRYCFDSSEYMHMKAAAMVLKYLATAKCFPVVNWMGLKLCEALKPYLVREDEKKGIKGEARHDISTLMNSTNGLLRSREKSWKLPQDFRPGDNVDDTGKAVGGPKPLPRVAQTAQSSKPYKHLDAKALPFSPRPSADGARAGIHKSDAEDGELHDAVMTDGSTKPTTVDASKSTENSTPQPSSRPELHIEEIRKKAMASAAASAARRRESNPGPGISNTTSMHTADAPQPASTANAVDSRSNHGSRSQTPSGLSRSQDPRDRSAPEYDREPHPLPGRPDTNSRDSRYAGRDARDGRDSRYGPDRAGSRTSAYEDTRGTRSGDTLTRPGDRSLRSDARLDAREEYRQGIPERNGNFSSRELRNDSRGLERGSRPDLQQTPSSRNLNRDSDAPARATPQAIAAPIEKGHLVNPERAALLSGSDTPHGPASKSRSPYPNHSMDHDRRSRPASPARSDHRGGISTRDDYNKEDRHSEPGRPLPRDNRGGPRDSATDNAPNGPRSISNLRNGILNDGPQRAHEQMQPPSFRSHDRGTHQYQDAAPRVDSRQNENYGRLNADANVPSSPAAHRNTSQPLHRQNQGLSTSNASSATPATEIRSYSSASTPTVDVQQQTGPPPGLHPSRLAAWNAENSSSNPNLPRVSPTRPTPLQTAAPSRLAQAEISPSVPPSGPRSATIRSGPEVPLNSPSGPRDRTSARSRDSTAARRFANLQETLIGGMPPHGPRHGMGSGSTGPSTPTLDQGQNIRGRAGPQQGNDIFGRRLSGQDIQPQMNPPPLVPQQVQQLPNSGLPQEQPTDFSRNRERDRLRPSDREREREHLDRHADRRHRDGDERSSRSGYREREDGRSTRSDLRGGMDQGPPRQEDRRESGGHKRAWGGEEGSIQGNIGDQNLGNGNGSVKRPRRGGRE